ncbi:MAG: type VI secretion system baseplate subunit TssG [Holosporales bacterium]|nr:type VI secretion system baseplate subunit TssG [Holosporales bacterium]
MFSFFQKDATSAKRQLKDVPNGTLALWEKLIFSPEKFSFAKAVDVAMALCGSQFVELRSNINFTSKYNDISVVEGLKDGIAEIYTNILGIAGVEGTLPDCYVEKFILFNRESKRAVIDFFSMFNNRMLTLRYMHMKRQNVESLSIPLEKSLIGNIMLSLSGFGFNIPAASRSQFSIPERFKVSAQNLFWRKTRSSSGLKTMLSSFFNLPIKIDQFIGGFTEIDKSEQTAVGAGKGKYNVLGKNSILGNKIWNSAKGIEIVIGPLNFETYTKFLPKKSPRDQAASFLQKMKEIIRMYVPHEIEVNLRFFLEKCLVKKTVLNGINRLNKDAFIFGLHKSGDAYFLEKV